VVVPPGNLLGLVVYFERISCGKVVDEAALAVVPDPDVRSLTLEI